MDRTPDATYELADDPGHPIPRVYAYDTALTFEGGGAYLGIVIATPLDATARSLMRLRAKEKFYLDGLYSEWGRHKWGTPKEGKMKIYVYIHPASSQEAFDMLSAFCSEARNRGVELVTIKAIPP